MPNKKTKKKNNLIYWWKKYFTKWAVKAKKNIKLSDYEIREEIKKHAQNQYDLIENNRPNKNLSVEEQANEIQLEYINWLKEVAKTGQLDYDL